MREYEDMFQLLRREQESPVSLDVQAELLKTKMLKRAGIAAVAYARQVRSRLSTLTSAKRSLG